jgi:hypothetical protein
LDAVKAVQSSFRLLGSQRRSAVVLPLSRAAWALTLLLAACPARAEAPDSTRQQAQQILTELEADSEHRPLTETAVGQARAALGRASEERRNKRHERAAVLEKVALTWAGLGRALVRTVALEKKAGDLEKEQNALETKLKRARALLEETLARRARARAALDKLEQPAAPDDAGARP